MSTRDLRKEIAQYSTVTRRIDSLRVPLILGKWQHFKRSGFDDRSLLNVLNWLCHMAWQGKYERDEYVTRDFFYYVISMTVPEEKISWLKAIHDDPALKRRLLEEEYVYHIYAETVNLAFSLIRNPKPDWDKELGELRRIARTAPSLCTEEHA